MILEIVKFVVIAYFSLYALIHMLFYMAPHSASLFIFQNRSITITIFVFFLEINQILYV